MTWNDVFWLVVGSGSILAGVYMVARRRENAALVPQFPVYAAVDRWRERTGRQAVNWIWFYAIVGTLASLAGALQVVGVASRNGWI